jgi:hypothetical protein
MGEAIFVSTSDEASKLVGSKIEFKCTVCGSVCTCTVRKDRPNTFKWLLCPKHARERTCMEKYGVKTNLVYDANPKKVWDEKKDSILEKRKKTSLLKYGCESPNQDASVQEKMRKTKLSNNSYEHQKLASMKTKEARYGNPYYHNVDKFKETLSNKRKTFEEKNQCVAFTTLVSLYGQGFKVLNLPKLYDESGNAYISNSYIKDIEAYASENHNMRSTSSKELELYEYVKEVYTGDVIRNSKSILDSGYELDIYLPDKKLAIEFNGIFWHSVNAGKSKDYHLNKTQQCLDKGIRLIHIFENDWDLKKDICKSIISSALGIYNEKIFARNCVVKKVSLKDSISFLDENHIQGGIKSSLSIGLYYKDELVELASFGRNRFSSGTELYRLCSKKGCFVVGGFSKLLHHSNLDCIVSYVDRSLFSGKGYESVGFKLDSITPPSYFYYSYKTGKLSRYQCQKKSLSKMLDNFDENLTESENMINNHFFKIYNCGTLKYIYRKEK